MEEFAYKQLATQGLAGLVILALGIFAWKMVSMLLTNSREYVEALKSIVVNNTQALNNNTKTMDGLAPRLDRIEDRLDNVPCEYAARSNDLQAGPPPSQRGRRAAPSNSNHQIIVSGGE